MIWITAVDGTSIRVIDMAIINIDPAGLRVMTSGITILEEMHPESDTRMMALMIETISGMAMSETIAITHVGDRTKTTATVLHCAKGLATVAKTSVVMIAFKSEHPLDIMTPST
jgi:hypothetical protein